MSSAAALGESPAVWLIKQEQLGRGHQAHRHGEDLPLATGKRARKGTLLFGEHGIAGIHRRAAFRSFCGFEKGRNRKFFGHRHGAEHILLLRHEGDTRPRAPQGIGALDGLPLEEDAP